MNSKRLSCIAKFAFGTALGFCALPVHAAFVTNTPSADTSLLEAAPTNSNGGQAFVISGHIQSPNRTRGLFRFECTNLPIEAIILSVVLELTVTRQPGDGLTNSNFGLHRMLRAWGEGSQAATNNFGYGLPADDGDATWLYSFYPTNTWNAPGGAPDLDFVAAESGFQYIVGADTTYRFESTPEMVSDVQAWVNDPVLNFGWMLMSDDEGSAFTARHFGAREDVNAHPNLEIEYLIPPHIDSAQRQGNQFALGFTAEAGQAYTVQFREFLNSSNSWITLTNISPPLETTNVVVTDSTSVGQRFYRLSTQ